MKSEDVSKFDQSAAFLSDSLPAVWYRMYSNCVKEGFSEDQALALVRTYIHASAGGPMERPR